MKDKIQTVSYLASAIGLAISIYLTAYHYANIALICTNQGAINCANVLNSPLAVILGIPIAVLGIPFFLIEIGLLYFRNLDSIAIWNIIGIGMVAYFIYLEKVIGNICIWCTGVHIVVLLLLILSLYRVVKIKNS